MRSLQAIRETKRLTDAGKWNVGKKMPRTAFQLSKSHSYTLGSSYEWIVCEAESERSHYRILVAFDPAKSQYRAWLGLVCGNDHAVLARLEFHPTHRGWHCHVKSGPVERVARGVVKESSGHETHRLCAAEKEFQVSQLDAQSVAFRVFNVFGQSPEAGGLFS